MHRSLRLAASSATAVLALAGSACAAVPATVNTPQVARVAATRAAVAPQAAAALPLAGKVVVIDPGHQLGNYSHPLQVNRKVNAGGGVRKPCNSTGTTTTSGYRESAYTMSVATYLKKRLVAQGATVYLTRPKESTKLWGPCVDVRGKFAGKVHADVLVSIHADGTPSRYHGFFVIRPAYRKGLTDDIYTSSRTLGHDIRSGLDAAGVTRANYLGGDGLDTRKDMGTLNWSSAPAVMVETGNMKNRRDAAHMKSARYRDTVFAAGLARGVTTFLRR